MMDEASVQEACPDRVDESHNPGDASQNSYVPTYLEAFPPLPVGQTGDHPAEAQGQGNKIRPQKTTVVTQVFHVPLAERKYKELSQFGEEQSKICLDIMKKSGANLEVSLAKDLGLSIMVTGKHEAVLRAHQEMVSRLQIQSTLSVSIPKEHHRFVIGRSGERLHDVELRTATKISIPPPDDPSSQIDISGTKDGIERARHEILLISADQDKRAVERVAIEKTFHPFISGPRGQTAAHLMEETGARINIPPPSVAKDEIVVTGDKESIARAVARIRDIYKEKKQTTKTIAVEVKKTQHRYVVGPKGNTLQDIFEQTGVSVEVPPSDSTSETVVLRGEVEKLGYALTQVYAKANSVVVLNVQVPAWLHRFLIGRKGQNISGLSQNYPQVHIEFTEGEDMIVLEGPVEEVYLAQSQLQDMASSLMDRMDFVELNIDPRFHRHLIGKNGANISRVKELYNVTVSFPADGDRSSLIRIEGSPDGVKQAERDLRDTVARLENEASKDLIVDQKYHRLIIGSKGERIKEVREKFPEVLISFPDVTQKSDVVRLRGPRTEVQTCAKFLEKQVEELVEVNFTLSVPIFKQFHKNVVGKGGGNIKKIREETNTRIELPTEMSESDVIVITGREADCLEARDKVLAIQRELASITELAVPIPAKLHTALIGSRGRQLRGIMDDCAGVHVHFPSEGSGSDTVTIRGPSPEAERAQKLLLTAAEEVQTKSFTAEVRAKPEYHGFLIGRGGSNIRKVKERTGTRIVFPSAQDPDQELISIVGSQEAVAQARQELLALIRDLDQVVEEQMTIAPCHHRHFVCRRGQVLRELAEEYGGVTVSFPRTGVKSDLVTLKGAKECVEAARRRIEEIVQDMDSQVSMECLIPQKYHRHLMGPKGTRVQQLSREHSVQIKFPERPPIGSGSTEQSTATTGEAGADSEGEDRKQDTIILSGREENCRHVSLKSPLCLLSQNLVPVTAEVDVPFQLHRFIIGQGGCNIRKTMEDYEVNVTVPPPDQQLDTIRITGSAASVEAARCHLLERVKEMQNEQEDRALRNFQISLSIDPRHHPKIIGRKGTVITQIRKEHDVNVQFPSRSAEHPELITITGYERHVRAAEASIIEMVQGWDDLKSKQISLDPRVHARIIGTRGKQIRKIMEDYKVEVRFPQAEAKDVRCVTVSGLPEHVEEAIHHLLNLEEEYLMDIADVCESWQQPSDSGTGQTDARGFAVREAPWDKADPLAPDVSSTEEFPAFSSVAARKASTVWGQRRF
ncbi:vigilin-like [Heterodontus francisci]|uniref:vigilin-like n=1 Tax=Heterodontus francisci TaxID=7792 RepID=UPI00355B0A43